MTAPYEHEPNPTPLIAEVTLQPEETDQLLQVATGLDNAIYHDSFADRGRFIEDAQALEKLLDESTAGSALKQLQSGSIVALTLSGLPTDPELPPAPLDGGTPHDKRTFVSEGVGIALADVLGYPSILLGEKKEALVHQITPVRGRETAQSNEGQVDLRFHQDLAPNPDLPSMTYHQTMPDWLILTGVQTGSGNTRTYISLVDDALEHISPESREILTQDRFTTNPPDSFLSAMPEAARKLPTHPILIERDGVTESVFDSSSDVRPAQGIKDTTALAALREFEDALTRVRKEVEIKPGVAIAFNNRRVVHGRSAIADEDNLADRRWIQRVYAYDVERLAKLSISKPGVTLQLGGGIVRLAGLSSNPGSRLLELANQ